MSWWRCSYDKFLFLVILGYVLYVPAFHAPFYFDDVIVVERNPYLQNPFSGWAWAHQIWIFQPSRFLANCSLGLNFRAHQLDVFGYHWVNWIIHMLTVLAVFYLTRLITCVRGVQAQKVDAAFWAALVFMAHPLATEAVTYISQRSSALVTLFYLLSFFFYIYAGKLKAKSKALSFAGAGCFGVLAILSKETAVTLPLAWMLGDHFIHQRKPRPVVWIALGAGILAVTAFFHFQFWQILTASTFSQSHRGDLLTVPTYLLTQLRVCVVFLNLIFVPVPLLLDYDFPMSRSLWEISTGGSFLFLAALIASAYRFRIRSWFYAFAVSWFFVSLLSHFLPVRANVISEHKLYLTLGLLVPILVLWLSTVLNPKNFMIVVICLASVFAFLTFERNVLWSNPVRFWQQVVRETSAKPRAVLNLGVAYFKARDLKNAAECYQKVIKAAPETLEAYTNMAAVFSEQGEYSKALEYSKEALKIDAGFMPALMHRSFVFMQMGKPKEAVESLNELIQRDPKQTQVYKYRGLIYDQWGKDLQALADFDEWLRLHPKDVKILSRRADIHFRRKEYQKTLADYDRLIELEPSNIHYYNRSVLYQILGKTTRNRLD